MFCFVCLVGGFCVVFLVLFKWFMFIVCITASVFMIGCFLLVVSLLACY